MPTRKTTANAKARAKAKAQAEAIKQRALKNNRTASRLLRHLAAKIDQGKAAFMIEGTRDDVVTELGVPSLDDMRPAHKVQTLREYSFRVSIRE